VSSTTHILLVDDDVFYGALGFGEQLPGVVHQDREANLNNKKRSARSKWKNLVCVWCALQQIYLKTSDPSNI
jgi:hypothetical protein